jgi:SAM-dependent methyltransferase
MTTDNNKALTVFFDVHTDLPREGPGNLESTKRALSLASPLPPNPKVLDIGCGPGKQTIDLAKLIPEATFTAIDFHTPFLAVGKMKADEAGVGDRITFQSADMNSLPFKDQSFDLIWCEGAAYLMGVENAINAWRRLLKPGGKLALTDAIWLRDDPPAELHRWWNEGYPDIQNIQQRRDLIRRCNYQLLGDFVLPAEAWWQDYYTPMVDRLDQLDSKYQHDEIAQGVLKECREEISFHERYSDYYSYAFFVMTLR